MINLTIILSVFYASIGKLDSIPDYHPKSKVEHKLTDVILLAICAVPSGQDYWKTLRLKPKRCGFPFGELQVKSFFYN